MTGGLALGGIALTLVGWRRREGIADEFNSACPTSALDATSFNECTLARDAAQRDVSGWETVTTVGLVVAGGAAVTSVILFATEPSGSVTWA